MADCAAQWVPPPVLQLDQAELRTAMTNAAAAGERWLLHPTATALTADPAQTVAHARLAAWVTAHAPEGGRSQGSMTLTDDTWLWGHEGSVLVEAGTYEMADIAARLGDPQPFAIPDPWGDSFSMREELGDLAAAAWWDMLPLDETQEAELARDLRSLLVAQHALAVTLPEAAAWVAEVTSVVVPLVSPPSSTFRSGTVSGLPGLVLVEITEKPLLTLEALVHESAHLHFHLEEANGPLIQPGHSQLYHSPLRVDPRPLRGVFLALHALVYMCGLYLDWQRATDDPRCLEALDELAASRDDAMKTVRAAADALTDRGQRFLAECLDLVDAEAPHA